MKELKPCVEWTKFSYCITGYDGQVLSVDTNCLPCCGENHLENKLGAASSIRLHYKEGNERKNKMIILAKECFEAETKEKVQLQVEQWVQARFDEIVEVLTKHYKVKI